MKQILLILMIVFISVVSLHGHESIDLGLKKIVCGTEYDVYIDTHEKNENSNFFDFGFSYIGGGYEVRLHDQYRPEGHLVIPSVHNNLPVIRIASFGFMDRDFESLYIPDSVTSIGDATFARSTKVAHITIPNSVKSIGRAAFEKSTSLESVILPINPYFTRIERETFMDCTSLKSILIPDSVEYIGIKAFAYCENLVSVKLPNNPNFTRINHGTFDWCRNLNNIVIPNSVTEIGSYSFIGNESLTEITIPNGVAVIESAAFSICRNLSEVILSNNLLYIGMSAFSSTNLLNIKIPESVTHIGSSAFRSTNLTSVNIPGNVSSIGNNPFSGCDKLESITVCTTNIHYRVEGNCLIRISDNTLISGTKNSIIPEGVVTIGWSSFSSITSLTSINIPNSVISIENGAFGFTNLVNVILGNSVTSIGSSAFRFNNSLEKIFIPISVQSISPQVFETCPNLTIYVEATSKPPGWHTHWNWFRPVVWGYVSEDDTVIMPLTTTLLGNYPNPFNPSTSIRYHVSGSRLKNPPYPPLKRGEDGVFVRINVYNVRGQLIRTLINEYHEPGEYSVIWNGTDDNGQRVGSGLYLYRLNVRDGMNVDCTVSTRKMILLK